MTSLGIKLLYLRVFTGDNFRMFFTQPEVPIILCDHTGVFKKDTYLEASFYNFLKTIWPHLFFQFVCCVRFFSTGGEK